jgi:halimadienyl-diphosphate synthase
LEKLVREGQGGVPAVWPIDIFEPGWVLYNVLLGTGPGDLEQIRVMAQRHIQYLCANWSPIGISTNSVLVPDADDTALAFMVLDSLGIAMNPNVFEHYEEADHIRCYQIETDPSTSTNVHVLAALCRHGVLLERKPQLVEKILQFLHQARTADTLWFDKWVASPFYCSTHAIMALLQVWDDVRAREMVEDCLYSFKHK